MSERTRTDRTLAQPHSTLLQARAATESIEDPTKTVEHVELFVWWMLEDLVAEETA